jgi:hypothetical protein
VQLCGLTSTATAASGASVKSGSREAGFWLVHLGCSNRLTFRLRQGKTLIIIPPNLHATLNPFANPCPFASCSARHELAVILGLY